MHKIYISTHSDQAYLPAVQEALYAINEVVIAADHWQDRAVATEQYQAWVSQKIEQASIFIGLYDQHTGALAAGETASCLELEYQQAVNLNKTILVFMMAGSIDAADPRQKAFLEHVQQQQVIHTFTDADDLAAQVKLTLATYRETSKQLLPRPLNLYDASRVRTHSTEQPDEESVSPEFAAMVEQAMTLAQDNIEQIVRRALEMHTAQAQLNAKPSPDYDNKVLVAPLWGEPLRRSQFQTDIFMIMPFRERFDGVYNEVIRPLAAQLNLTIKRGDDFSSVQGVIMDEVWAAMNACKLVIAETSELNANVYYELGIAHTLGKPVILLTQTQDVQDLPFDIRHLRFLVYHDSIEGSADLKKRLRQNIIWLMNDLDEQATD